jgi:hypothetical protein
MNQEDEDEIETRYKIDSAQGQSCQESIVLCGFKVLIVQRRISSLQQVNLDCAQIYPGRVEQAHAYERDGFREIVSRPVSIQPSKLILTDTVSDFHLQQDPTSP